jgi:hypothetical protein
MTQWQIQPAGVHAILSQVNTAAGDLGAALTDQKLAGVVAGLPTNPILHPVGTAVEAVLQDQGRNLQTISNRINAGVVGVSNAVIAYNNGQQDMAGTYQTELVRAAESGDFTFFVEHGHQG